MRNYSQFFAILKKIGWDKEETIETFTNGRTKSLKDLTDKEFANLMVRLQPYNKVPPGDKARKKMISLARQMHWGETSQAIVQRLDGWCLKQKYRKPLMQLNEAELGLMLAVFEQRVYADYLTGLNK